MGRATTFKSWSYSRYSDWARCPQYAKFKHLDKLQEPRNNAMNRGIEIGEAGEAYLTRRTTRLHPELKPVADRYKRLRERKNLVVEQQWGFDKNWLPVPWDDWSNCVVRVKMDISFVDLDSNVLVVIDAKTGKYRPDNISVYRDQLEIYTIGGFAQYPDIEGVDASLLYTDHGIEYPEEITVVDRAQGEVLKKRWNKKVAPMLRDTRFLPKPNSGCRWCHFRSENGGPCKY